MRSSAGQGGYRVPTRRIVVVLMGFIVLFAGCQAPQSALDELILDDRWALSEIKTGSIITTDLNDYLTVTFDSDTEEVTYQTGSAWPSAIDVNGTYDYTINGAANEITLAQGGTTEYTITYDFDPDLDEMTWTAWIAEGSGAEIVGGSATIEYIKFVRN